jgi:hypothetical protein
MTDRLMEKSDKPDLSRLLLIPAGGVAGLLSLVRAARKAGQAVSRTGSDLG